MHPLSILCYSPVFALLCATSVTCANEREQDIETITVTARATQNRALHPAETFNSEQLERLTPSTFADVFRNVPGVGVRTNSRGETILRIRGSDERQTQVFLDGAPFTIPWDSRLDLNMLPASLIRHVSVVKSAAPIEYGANAVLGVVDISTEAMGSDTELRSRLELGSQNKRLIEGEFYQPGDFIDVQLGASSQSLDGQPIADKAPIPFETAQHLRTNTDQQQQSYFGAASWSGDTMSWRLSRVEVDAKKGIASQGHLSPASDQVRFWRYPDWHLLQHNLSGQFALSPDTGLRVVTWHQQFEQVIASYDNSLYQQIEQRQFDDDVSTGSRFVIEHQSGAMSGRFVGSYSQSRHCQIEVVVSAKSSAPEECFEQVMASTGGELDWQWRHGHKLSLASAYDYTDTPQTGGRPAQPSITRWAGSVVYQFDGLDSFAISSSVGQRTRFPSMRELYGTSLGKFVTNPDLQPETAMLVDVSFENNMRDDAFRWSLTPWFSHVSNTLTMRSVVVNGKSLRQRYNLKGSAGYGIESNLTVQLSAQLQLSTNLFWQHLRSDPEINQNEARLLQRPSSQLTLVADYIFANDWRSSVELERTGNAYDEDFDGSLVQLPDAVKVNIKAFVPLPIKSEQGRWQLYVSLNNVTNEVVLPQLGLPEPGRAVAVGVQFY